jgi:hypothetical protein
MYVVKYPEFFCVAHFGNLKILREFSSSPVCGTEHLFGQLRSAKDFVSCWQCMVTIC